MRRIVTLCLSLWLALLPLGGLSAPAARFGAHPEVSGQPGLYLLSAQPEQGIATSMALRGQQALILLSPDQQDQPSQLLLYDMQAGEALHRASIGPSSTRAGGAMRAGFLADGRPYLLDLGAIELRLYDQALNLQTSFTPPGTAELYEPRLSPDGQYLWAGDLESHEALGYPLAGGQALRLRSPLPGQWMFAGFAQIGADELLVIFQDNAGHQALHTYQISTGQTRVQPLMQGFVFHDGDGWVYQIRGQVALFARAGAPGALLRVAAWREHEYPLYFQGDQMISQPPDGTGMRLYDLQRGLLLGELGDVSSYTHQGFDQIALSDEGYALLSDSDFDSGSTRFFLWDHALQALNTPVGMRQTSYDEMAMDNDVLAAEIEAEFGVKIHLREAGTGFHNPVYYAQICQDEVAIARTLESLRDFLADLPPGLIAASLTGAYTHLSFYLSGLILPKGEEGISAASGLSSDHGQERYIILDATDMRARGNLAHEYMHVLEDSLLAWDNAHHGESLGRFELLSPPAWELGGYNWGYRMADGSEMYETAFTTHAEDPQPDNIYYIDAYSRSLPLEDRARLFEYLFMQEASLQVMLGYPHLLRKAQYLAALLRQAFPLIQEPPIWERPLPQPENGDWTQFLAIDLPEAA